MNKCSLVADLIPFKGACQPPYWPILHSSSLPVEIRVLVPVLQGFHFSVFHNTVLPFSLNSSVLLFLSSSLSRISAFCLSISFCSALNNCLGRGYPSRNLRMKTAHLTSGLNWTCLLMLSKLSEKKREPLHSFYRQFGRKTGRGQTGLNLNPRRYQSSQILNVPIEWYNFNIFNIFIG